MKEKPHVKLEIKDGIAKLKLNCPKARNFLNEARIQKVIAAFLEKRAPNWAKHHEIP